MSNFDFGDLSLTIEIFELRILFLCIHTVVDAKRGLEVSGYRAGVD